MTTETIPIIDSPPFLGEKPDEWILSRRGPRNAVDADRAYASMVEPERAESGEILPIATVFLTNRECPFRCLMCDLWKNTLSGSVPAGAIPTQIARALEPLPPARQIKLYNSGSFFDPGAIPPEDYPAIARLAAGFDRVIVECHPGFLGQRCLEFQSLLGGKLEVAIGLETANLDVLGLLNKRMTRESFARAGEFLRDHNIALRVFILLRPPFLSEEQGLYWAKRSIDFAFDCGATVCCVIPTRGGNGALEELAATGYFSPPRLESLEAALDYGIPLGRGRVFADLWDLERFRVCPACFSARLERLERMNLEQVVLEPVACPHCGVGIHNYTDEIGPMMAMNSAG